MARSYNQLPTAGVSTFPIEWTQEQPHKHCGKLERGRKGKPNKAHRCDACLAVKASGAKSARQDMASRRREKMGWHAGEF